MNGRYRMATGLILVAWLALAILAMHLWGPSACTDSVYGCGG